MSIAISVGEQVCVRTNHYDLPIVRVCAKSFISAKKKKKYLEIPSLVRMSINNANIFVMIESLNGRIAISSQNPGVIFRYRALNSQ